MNFKFCFVVSVEASANNYWYNQLVLLLYSFRKNSGALKNSFFYISVNDDSFSSNQVDFLENNFGPLKLSVNECPSILGKKGREGWLRKYNLFGHFKNYKDFNKIIYLDTDFIFLSDFSDLLKSCKDNDFSAHCVGKQRCNHKYEQFILENSSIDRKKLLNLKIKWAKCIKKTNEVSEPSYSWQIPKSIIYPYFNSGFLVMTPFAFDIIKHNILPMYEKVNEKINIYKNAIPVEQAGLSTLIMEKVKNFSVMKPFFFGPEAFHMFKSAYGTDHYLCDTEDFNLFSYSNKSNSLQAMKIIRDSFEKDFPKFSFSKP
tara:strand:- start:8419 stop:9363 length:945 start_codon:yes stop_codon:yes gene_type:complete